MLITNENIDIWYKEYKAQFERSTKYVKSRKGATRGLTMSSKSEFRMDLLSEHYDNPKLSGTQIAKKIAKSEVFAVSHKQATKSAEAHVNEFGGRVTMDLINKYRTQSISDIFDVAEARRSELRRQGLSSSEIAFAIGQEFFGSD